jgi:hypothetical protein
VTYAGQGLGEASLFDAIKTVAAPIGAHAIFADAIDDKARPSMRHSASRL